MYYSTLSILISLIIHTTKATTEWFGDARAHMNPPQQPPFYDIVYDESGKNKILLSIERKEKTFLEILTELHYEI